MLISKFTEEKLEIESKANESLQKNLSEQALKFSEETKSLKREIKVFENRATEFLKREKNMEENFSTLNKTILDLKLMLETKEKQISELTLDLQKYKSQSNVSNEILNTIENTYMNKIDQEREKRLVEINFLKDQIEKIKNEHRDEISALHESQNIQMEEFEDRVKKIVGKKDNEINRLKEEIKIKVLEIEKYAELLEKQRKNFSNLS